MLHPQKIKRREHNHKIKGNHPAQQRKKGETELTGKQGLKWQ